ncbi:MAG: chemotaxis protein CheW [Spirochaetales bacterium]
MSDAIIENSTDEKTRQYVTFLLDSELYALDVQNARTVIHAARITRLPRTEPYVVGLIDYRGHGIPLIDLNLKLNVSENLNGNPSEGAHEEREVPPESAVLIVDLPNGEEHITVGVIVDEVHEVIALDETTIEPVPAVGTRCDREFLRGFARHGDTFLLVLHAERILESGEVARLA